MKRENEQIQPSGEATPMQVSEQVREAGVVTHHEQDDLAQAVSEIRQAGVEAQALGPHTPLTTEPSPFSVKQIELLIQNKQKKARRMPFFSSGRWKMIKDALSLERKELKRAA